MNFNSLRLATAMLGIMLIPSANAQIKKTDATRIVVNTPDRPAMTLDFYADNIVRVYQDGQGRPVHDPQAKPEAKILTDNPRTPLTSLEVKSDGNTYVAQTAAIRISIDAKTGALKMEDSKTGRTLMEQIRPTSLGEKTEVVLKERPNEYFYGGGVQNGRFSHKGKQISIVNQNSWTDGGVASPNPFYWSTAGYAVMFHTFRPGLYDFGATQAGEVRLEHDADYLDMFIMAGDSPVALLDRYYQLTGHPALLPKFGFYEGHLNAYNRDYWKETDKPEAGVPFEDGKRYVESMTDNGGIRESLNGEMEGNYQFSARAVVDRYKAQDMPLGWVLPNDGYGAGYGQTPTLDGNIENLRQFGDYARKNGVEIGLWTQSDLHPVDSIEPLLQRDIVKEIGVAGVRILKTDVAWVGDGYSFGLNGIADAASLMPKHGDNARPMIITLDGWAGTQRYAGVWTGDQTGGKWEYIRFHIPTYIGAGLSGMPNICSDMDGIFGGKNVPVNVRDFQWKTFTPMELNMDGWGANEKYPHALGEKATFINRRYLKLKSALMPYTYSIAYQSVTDKPMVRAMFLDYPNDFTYGTATRYQFMYGPSILVAPIYQDTRMQENGDDERDGIYLPEGEWIDWHSHVVYRGGRIINNYDAPLSLLPIFLKRGAIIPMTKEHNNPNEDKGDKRIYRIVPSEEATSFTEYDDDGRTQEYLSGAHATTKISQQLDAKKNRLVITIAPTEGEFKGMATQRQATIDIVSATAPKKVQARIGKKKAPCAYELLQANENDNQGTCVPKEHNVPAFRGGNGIVRIVLPKADVRQLTTITIDGITLDTNEPLLKKEGTLAAPKAKDTKTEAYALTPQWETPTNADYCEIAYEGQIYSTLRHGELRFEDLKPETTYSFKLRAVNKSGQSDWTSISATTSPDPLQHAIRNITATCTSEAQPGEGLRKLVDFNESTMWHTAYGKEATPFTLTLDLHAVSTLDRFEYLPRVVGLNGVITNGSVSYSLDKAEWTEAGAFQWSADASRKSFEFKGQPTARYIRINVTKAVGKFGSGQEIYIFRVPGSPSFIPGDINADGMLDRNDLTSYLNYTGLRFGDKDFEGYVSKGDINGNKLIDAYDISNVAVAIDGDGSTPAETEPEGRLLLVPDKANYRAGETVTITVKGLGLNAVNALSFALPYQPNQYEFLGIDQLETTAKMENFTKDRLHSNGQKALYPTLVNVGQQPEISGSEALFTLRFRALKAGAFAPQLTDGILVSRSLLCKTF